MSFVRSPGLETGKYSRIKSLATVQFNMPHITFYQWSVVTMCLSCIVSETLIV